MGLNGSAPHAPAPADLDVVRAIIERFGWAIHGQDGRSYTIGLTEKDLPELVVAHLTQETAKLVLNTMARAATEGGPLVPGRIYTINQMNLPGRGWGWQPERMPPDQGRLACPGATAMYGKRLRVLFLRRLVETPDAPAGGLIVPN